VLSLLILIPLACLLLISFLPLKGKRVAFAVVMALSFFQIYAVFSPTIMANRRQPEPDHAFVYRYRYFYRVVGRRAFC
jgi:NADH:ubiquinone oxidoreductase subunit 4 (subunit M)